MSRTKKYTLTLSWISFAIGLRVMNPEDDVDEDADLCKFVKYQQILDTPLATYYKSDTDVSTH